MVRALFSSDQTSLGTPNLNLTPVSPTLITVSSSNESDFNITTPPLLGPEGINKFLQKLFQIIGQISKAV